VSLKHNHAYTISTEIPEEKRPFGRPRYRWKDNNKTGRKEMGFEDAKWINFTQVTDH
jgi:hypothetical protein